jgi:sarcosine oxidase subunit gamma
MVEPRTPFRRPPLNHRYPIEGEDGAVRLSETPFLGKFILRVDPQGAAEPIRTALGMSLPVEALTSATAGETSILWMGPDEWMLVTPADQAAPQSAKAREALAGLHHQLVDVSDYYTVIDISGAKARELLMKLTTLDLHSRAFRAGMVTGSVFGRANAMIWQIIDDKEPGGPLFRLFIRWSMADYLWCALAEAGREWGVPEQIPVKGETLIVHA